MKADAPPSQDGPSPEEIQAAAARLADLHNQTDKPDFDPAEYHALHYLANGQFPPNGIK